MEKEEILSRAKKYIADEKDERFRKEVEELVAKGDMKELEDRFYQTLEFGTGGLRGVMGGGTNRMNTLEINLATQGLANYVLKAFPEKAKDGTLSAVIAYDSRKNSDVFAEATALILAANGIKAYLFTGLRPTPELSFAIRELKAQTGVVVTASHNPPQYNGYKVYGEDGAQLGPEAASAVTEKINALTFTEAKLVTEEEAKASGLLHIIGNAEVDDDYIELVKTLSIYPEVVAEAGKNLKIV